MSRIKLTDDEERELRKIGLFLRELRINLNLTQKDVANEANINVGTIYNIERSITCRYSVAMIIKLSRVYGIPISQLFVDIED